MEKPTFENLPQTVYDLSIQLQRIENLLNNKAEIKDNEKQHLEWVTRQKVAQMFDVDISTVHNWSVKGKIKPYGIGNRVYYKRHELDEALISIRSEK